MYKIVNGDAPAYLIDLLPNRVNDINTYSLRNSNGFQISFSRLCSYETSFFPSTLKLRNELHPQIRTLPTISQFKSNIQIIPDKIADYTNIGERKYSIILARIRHRCNSFITKTRLFKYTENCTTKKRKFSDKKILIFFMFLLKT